MICNFSWACLMDTNDQTHYQFIFIQQLTSNKATLENKLFQTQGQDRLFLR